MAIALYQFPLSHYCEKARWALDYKGLEFETRNLLPGFHAATTKKLCGRSSVPLVAHDGKVIHNSSNIITYLDDTFTENQLTPGDPELQQKALHWERYADKEIGPAVRLCFYHLALDYPSLVIPLFTQGGPWYGKYFYRVIFPGLRKKMRALMKINEESYQLSLDKLSKAVDKLSEQRDGRLYLVNDDFTRADLAAGALLAPFCKPAKYGLQWPVQFPESLQNLFDNFADRISWVSGLYEQHR